MSLQAQLTKVYNDFHATAPPEITTPIRAAAATNAATFDLSSVIQVGDLLPSFTLTSALGIQTSSSTFLSGGKPLLLTFYRGEWCPFCNLMLRAMQTVLPQIETRGVSFIAISGELPSTSVTTAEKNELTFPVLSDVGHAYARKLGLVFKQNEELRPVLKSIGVEWEKQYGDDSFEVPVPATILVDEKGVVRNVFVDTDYSKRLEPDTALKWIDALKIERGEIWL